MKYALIHSLSGQPDTFRAYDTIASATAAMRAAYFDELADDSHAEKAGDKGFRFLLASKRAIIQWNPDLRHEWRIELLRGLHRYTVTLRKPDGKTTTLESFLTRDPWIGRCALPKHAFALAADGGCGEYPAPPAMNNIKFTDAVSAGIDHVKHTWTARDGSVVAVTADLKTILSNLKEENNNEKIQ